MAVHLFPSNRVISYNVTTYKRYCEGGELFNFIMQKKFLNEKEAAMIMKQSFSALKYLHEANISHR
jgi:serine/threonine protein kinase